MKIIKGENITVPITGKTYDINVRATCPEVISWKGGVSGSIKQLFKFSSTLNPVWFSVSPNGIGNKSGTLSISGYTESGTDVCESGDTSGASIVYQYQMYMDGYKGNITANIALVSGSSEVVLPNPYVCDVNGSNNIKLKITSVPPGVPSAVTVTISNPFVKWVKQSQSTSTTTPPPSTTTPGPLDAQSVLAGDHFEVMKNTTPNARTSIITVTVTTEETSDYYSSSTVQTFEIQQKAVPVITIKQRGLIDPFSSDGGSFNIIIEAGEYDGTISYTATPTATYAPCLVYNPEKIDDVSSAGSVYTALIYSERIWSANTEENGWIQISTGASSPDTSVTGVANSQYYLNIKVLGNNVTDQRTGYITFSMANFTPSQPLKLKITQLPSSGPIESVNPTRTRKKKSATLLGAQGELGGGGETIPFPEWCTLVEPFDYDYGYQVNIAKNKALCQHETEIKVEASTTGYGLYNPASATKVFKIRQSQNSGEFDPDIKTRYTVNLSADDLKFYKYGSSVPLNPQEIDVLSEGFKNDGTDRYQVKFNLKITADPDYPVDSRFKANVQVYSLSDWLKFENTSLSNKQNNDACSFVFKVSPTTSLSPRTANIRIKLTGTTRTFEDASSIFTYNENVVSASITETSPQAWICACTLNCSESLMDTVFVDNTMETVRYTGYGSDKAPVKTSFGTDVPLLYYGYSFESVPTGVNIPFTAQTTPGGDTQDDFFHLWKGSNSTYNRTNLIMGTGKTGNDGKYNSFIPIGIDEVTQNSVDERTGVFTIKLPEGVTPSGKSSAFTREIKQEPAPLPGVSPVIWFRKSFKQTQQSTPCPFYGKMQFTWNRLDQQDVKYIINISDTSTCDVDSIDYIRCETYNQDRIIPPGGGETDGILMFNSAETEFNPYIINDIYVRIFTYSETGVMTNMFDGNLSKLINSPIIGNVKYKYLCNQGPYMHSNNSLGLVMSNYSDSGELILTPKLCSYYDKWKSRTPQFGYKIDLKNNRKLTENTCEPTDSGDITIECYATNGNLINNPVGSVTGITLNGQTFDTVKILGRVIYTSCEMLPDYIANVTTEIPVETILDTEPEFTDFELSHLDECYDWPSQHYDSNYPTAYFFRLTTNSNDITGNGEDFDGSTDNKTSLFIYLQREDGSWERVYKVDFSVDDILDELH